MENKEKQSLLEQFLREKGIYHMTVNAYVDYAYDRVHGTVPPVCTRSENTRKFHENDKVRAEELIRRIKRANHAEQAPSITGTFNWANARRFGLDVDCGWVALSYKFAEWARSRNS
jgi:hypothetical protein